MSQVSCQTALSRIIVFDIVQTYCLSDRNGIRTRSLHRDRVARWPVTPCSHCIYPVSTHAGIVTVLYGRTHPSDYNGIWTRNLHRDRVARYPVTPCSHIFKIKGLRPWPFPTTPSLYFGGTVVTHAFWAVGVSGSGFVKTGKILLRSFIDFFLIRRLLRSSETAISYGRIYSYFLTVCLADIPRHHISDG